MITSRNIILAYLITTWLFLPKAFGQPTLIETLFHYEQAVVTVKGQTLTLSPETKKAASLDPTSGKVVILESHGAQVKENVGAGIVIDSSGVIVTNTHIIFGAQIIKILLKDGSEFSARVLFISPEDDFSILKIDIPHPLTAIVWGDQEPLELGEDVVTIGHSPLLNATLSGGKIVGIGQKSTEPSAPPEFLELNINHYSGDSGGPVFDNQGRFLGLLNAKLLRADRVAFAIPAYKIHFAYLNLADKLKKQ